MTQIDITTDITVYLSDIKRVAPETGRQAEQRTVRQMLSLIFGPEVTLCHRADGAPFLERNQATISISHCRTTAAIAVSRSGTPIGIDIESADRSGQLARVSARFLAPDELPHWSANPDLLLQAWTAKEAAFKAAGVQLADLRRIRLNVAGDDIVVGDVRVKILRQFRHGDNYITVVRLKD